MVASQFDLEMQISCEIDIHWSMVTDLTRNCSSDTGSSSSPYDDVVTIIYQQGPYDLFGEALADEPDTMRAILPQDPARCFKREGRQQLLIVMGTVNVMFIESLVKCPSRVPLPR